DELLCNFRYLRKSMTLKVWVTGSRGFVGSSLVKALAKRDYDLTCVSSSEVEGFAFVDFASRDSIRTALKIFGTPDIVYHLGWANVYEPESDIHLSYNLSNTKNL